jgi:plastocyanin
MVAILFEARSIVLRVAVVLIASALASACSTYQPASAPSPVPPPTSAPVPAPTPDGSATVTITSAGFSPLQITISVGQRITFVNNDTRNHDLVGGIDPAHPDCPEVAVAGFITPGQQRDTGVFTAARSCDYHDHAAIGVPAFQGKIIVQ